MAGASLPTLVPLSLTLASSPALSLPPDNTMSVFDDGSVLDDAFTISLDGATLCETYLGAPNK